MGIGEWGLGIGDWGLGPSPNPQNIGKIKIRYLKIILQQLNNFLFNFTIIYYNSFNL